MSSVADQQELAHFSGLAARWWDPEGPSRPLFDINPVRLNYALKQVPAGGRLRCLDVGCGGGILSEALARAGHQVTGLDMSGELLEVARLHAIEQALLVDYVESDLVAFAQAQAGAGFDLITCMEMLEHVPDPSAIVRACVSLLKPNGVLVLSTLNRTSKAFALGIVAAEYVLGLVPRGTHRYAKFIKPSELARAVRDAGATVSDCSGMIYNPFTRRAFLDSDCSLNYLMTVRL
jgi:2-polyprenyl-6-hydroxyphenyl methylase / 3-demethylubiquinone-9 3-methyltransferase